MFGQSSPLPKKIQFFLSIFLLVSSESWRAQNFRTPWSYTKTKDLRKISLWELRESSFITPKNCTLNPSSWHKTFFTMTKEKHRSKWHRSKHMPKTIFLPFLGGLTYLDFGPRLFQPGGHYMVPISCKASYNIYNSSQDYFSKVWS